MRETTPPGDGETPVDAERFEEIKDWVSTITPAFTEVTCHCAAVAMGYIEHAVLDGRQAMPFVSFVKNHKIGIMATEFVEDFGSVDKEVFAKAIRNLRKDCETVVFSTEAWMAQIDKKEWNNKTWVQPSKHPQRQEVGMVHVYLPGRLVCLMSKIHRDPLHMEDWEVMNDTIKDGHGMGGRFGE